MLKFFKNLFSNSLKDSSLQPPLKQVEREAIIDLLLLGIYGDNHLSLSESNELNIATGSLGWESKQDLSVYIDSSVVRIRKVRLNEEAIIESIDADTIYDVPNLMLSEGLHEVVLKKLDMEKCLFRESGYASSLSKFCRIKWQELSIVENLKL